MLLFSFGRHKKVTFCFYHKCIQQQSIIASEFEWSLVEKKKKKKLEIIIQQPKKMLTFTCFISVVSSKFDLGMCVMVLLKNYVQVFKLRFFDT